MTDRDKETPDFYGQAQQEKDTRVLPPGAVRWSDECIQNATAVLLYRLLWEHIPAKVLLDLVKDIEGKFQEAAAISFEDPEDHLARYAVQLARRLEKCTADQVRAREEVCAWMDRRLRLVPEGGDPVKP